MMRTFSFGAMTLALCVLLGSAVGHAAAITAITGQLWLDHPDVAADATIDHALALGAPDATFTSDAINYDSTRRGFQVLTMHYFTLSWQRASINSSARENNLILYILSFTVASIIDHRALRQF